MQSTPSFRFLIGWLLGFAELSFAGEAAPPPAESKPVDYLIVVTGGELLEGAYPDAHTYFLTRTLRPLGCRCLGSLVVDDSRLDIQEALRFATNKARLVVVTGGLGPTPNDITRETLSEFTGIPLREDEEVLEAMEKRFDQPRDQLQPNLRRQTQVPVRGGYLKNPNGTAVGLIFEPGDSVIVALPGPPRELQTMVTNELLPFLRQRFGARPLGASLTLRFVGAGQSLIDQTIKSHLRLAPEVIVTSLFEGSRVDFTFSLPGHTPQDQARLEQLRAGIRKHLGQYLYGEGTESLEAVVIQALRARGGSLVLAEVGTGGSLAAALNVVPGAAQVLAGAYAAPTEEAIARLLRLPSDQPAQWSSGGDRAKGLAAAAAALTHSQWAVAVSQAEGETPSSRAVWVAYRLADERWETRRLGLRDSGELGRSSLVTQVLDHLRQQLK